MSKRTLDAFLCPSPGKRESPRLSRKVPRLNDVQKSPKSNTKLKRSSPTLSISRNSSNNTPASPRFAVTKEEVIVIDSDNDEDRGTIATNEAVETKKLCIVCSKHEILSSLDLCVVCAGAFEEDEIDPFTTREAAIISTVAVEMDDEEVLVRDVGPEDDEEVSEQVGEKGVVDLTEDQDNHPEVQASALGVVADYILPIVSKPAKLLQTTLFSMFGKPEPPSQKQEKPRIVREESGTRGRWQSFTSGEPPMRQSAPYYKRVPTTSFLVDGFRFKYMDPPNPIYFLTHFHSDHYGGLTKTFNRGPIYLNEVTANLVEHELGVNRKYLNVVPMRTPILVDNPLGNPVEVTFLDANHCPGSSLILFKLAGGTYHLHCGDMRYSSTIPDFEFAARLGIDTLYLDTTYCDPRYVFPTQGKVIEKCLEVVRNDIQRSDTIIVVGSYTIGKERLFIAAAQHYNCKIYVDPHKFGIVQCLNYPQEISSLFVRNPQMAKIHVVSMFNLSYKKLQEYVRSLGWPISRAVGFKPTGWTFSGKESKNSVDFLTRRQQGNVVVWDVPYSEHSSFNELRDFVALVKPKRIVPTVNNTSTEKVNEMIAFLTA